MANKLYRKVVEARPGTAGALTICHAASDGECTHPRCPQILDGYCDSNGNPIGPPSRPHRDCPLPW